MALKNLRVQSPLLATLAKGKELRKIHSFTRSRFVIRARGMVLLSEILAKSVVE